MDITVTIPIGAASITLSADNSKDLDALLAAANDRIEAIAIAAGIAATAAATHGLTAPAPVAPAAVAAPAIVPGENGPVTVSHVEPDPIIKDGGKPRPEGVSAPSCKHGIMRWLSGENSNGYVYAMWGCTSSDRGDQCKPDYSNTK